MYSTEEVCEHVSELIGEDVSVARARRWAQRHGVRRFGYSFAWSDDDVLKYRRHLGDESRETCEDCGSIHVGACVEPDNADDDEEDDDEEDDDEDDDDEEDDDEDDDADPEDEDDEHDDD